MKTLDRNFLRSILFVFLIAMTVLAQDPKTNPAPAATPPAPTSTAQLARKHHRTRTVLIVLGVAAAATAGALVAVSHKSSSAPQHCNGPNPTTCSPE